MKKTYFNRDEDICWPPQCHNFGSTAGAGGFTAGAAAPAVNMLEKALLLISGDCVTRLVLFHGPKSLRHISYITLVRTF